MKFESLEKFMESELSERLMSITHGGRAPGNGSTQGGEVCLTAEDQGLSSGTCMTYESDTTWSSGVIFYNNGTDSDKPC